MTCTSGRLKLCRSPLAPRTSSSRCIRFRRIRRSGRWRERLSTDQGVTKRPRPLVVGGAQRLPLQAGTVLRSSWPGLSGPPGAVRCGAKLSWPGQAGPGQFGKKHAILLFLGVALNGQREPLIAIGRDTRTDSSIPGHSASIGHEHTRLTRHIRAEVPRTFR